MAYVAPWTITATRRPASACGVCARRFSSQLGSGDQTGASTAQDQLDSSFREYQKNLTEARRGCLLEDYSRWAEVTRHGQRWRRERGRFVVGAPRLSHQVLEDMVLWAQPASPTTLMRAKTLHQQANQAAGDVATRP
jgi:hypothetical protein